MFNYFKSFVLLIKSQNLIKKLIYFTKLKNYLILKRKYKKGILLK